MKTKAENEEFIKVTKLNEDEIEKEMDELKKQSIRFNKRNDKTYLIYKERYSNDTVQDKILNHGGFIYYYTEDRVPLPIINKLAGIPQSEVIFYTQRTYTTEEVTNIQLTSMATKVTMDVPIVLPDINPYAYLFALHPLRYHVDKVNISFPALTVGEIKQRHKKYYNKIKGRYYLKPKYKHTCFTHLQEPLSTWKMNIWMISDNEEDLKNVQTRVAEANKRYKNKIEKQEQQEKRKKEKEKKIQNAPIKGGKPNARK